VALGAAHVPAKACPDLIRGGDRFAAKNMRNSTNLERVALPKKRDAL
jgi:hypothetical protein